MKRRTKIIGALLILVLVIVGVSIALRPAQNTDENTPKPQKPLETVDVMTFSEIGANKNYLSAYGVVDAVNELDLSFEVNGTVDRVFAYPGKQVKQGDAIAILKNDNLAAQVSQAAAAYDASFNSFLSFQSGARWEQVEQARSALRISMEQLDQLWDQHEEVVNGVEIDLSDEIELQEEIVLQNRLSLEILESDPKRTDTAAQWALVEQSRSALQNVVSTYDGIILRAPFSGEVVSLSLTEGELINPGQPVGKIINKSHVEVVSYLATEEANLIDGYNPVIVDGRYSGQVIGISTRVDEMTRKRKIRISLDHLGDLTVGDTVDIEIQESKVPNVHLLPLSAVIFDDDGQYVYVYSNGKISRKSIVTGGVRGDFIQAINLPKEPIVKVARGLSDGQKVNAE